MRRERWTPDPVSWGYRPQVSGPDYNGGRASYTRRIGEAVWGSGAMRLAKCEIAAYRRNIESLERMLAGLGETEPAQTD